MADQLSGLYVATFFLAIFGVAVFVNALLIHGLRWTGRRLANLWRAHAHGDDHPPVGGADGREPASPFR